jgi:mono/diheme cytochrome c family protein
MFPRFRIALSLALLVTVALAVPAFAGGWAVITLDKLPSGVVAGEPFEIGFTVLQHGKTPMADLAPTITASLSKSDTFVVNAKPEGATGHYAATLTFPKQGNWGWSIQAFTMDQAMPELSVATPNANSVNQPAANTQPGTMLLIVRVSAFIFGLMSLALAYQRKSRLAMGLGVFCLLVGGASFVTGSNLPVRVEAADSSVSQVELGRQLFIAKGCITCHVNTRASLGADYWTLDMGAPNLSKFSADAGYLDKWLFNPSALKPATQMPNLHLSENERAALIAFINSK